MLKKVIVGLLVFGFSSLFAMSLSELNSATKEDLMKINGIGAVKAAAIIKERKNGKFKSIEDLTRVKGIGKKIAVNVKNDTKKKVASKKSKVVKKVTDSKAKATKKLKVNSIDEKKKELKTKAKKTESKKN